jgi:hypothetical protein
MHNLKELATDIINGKFSIEEMKVIAIALRERRRVQIAETVSVLRIGSEVEIFDITPKHWNGMKAEIIGFAKRGTRVDLRITDNKRRYQADIGSVQIGFPMKCLKPLGTVIMDEPFKASDGDAAFLHAYLTT